MKPYWKIAAPLYFFLSSFVCAQSPPTEETSFALLDKAAELTNLETPDTLPYRLCAHLKFLDYHGGATEGEFTFVFASPSRWRKETTRLGTTSVEVLVQDHVWRKDVDVRRIDLLRLDRLRHFSELLASLPGGKLSAPHKKILEGITSECINSTNRSALREVCLDSATGLPLRVKDDSIEFDFDGGDYLPLAIKRFPRRIRYAEHKHTVLEMEVHSLEALGNGSEEMFTPPPTSASLPWCPNERRAYPERFGGSQHGKMRLPGAPPISGVGLPLSEFSLLIFDVGADGHVKDLKAYDKQGSLLSGNADAEKLRVWVFRPAVCRNEAVEGEFIIWPSQP